MDNEGNRLIYTRIDTTRKLPLIKLREKADEGDAVAVLLFGEKTLESLNENERNKGAYSIIDALNSIENDYIRGDITKDDLIDAIVEGTDALLNKYNGTDEFISKETFKLCQNAYELDNTRTKGLGICYERGVGCAPDEDKSNYYKEQTAVNGDFIEKAEIFSGYVKKGKGINAVIWAQRALADDHSDDYPKLRDRIRMWLAENGEPDNHGDYINLNSAKAKYNDNLFECSVEESEILFELACNDDEKYHFAKIGASKYFSLGEYYTKQNAILQAKKIQEENKKREDEKKRIQLIKTWSIRAGIGLLIVIGIAILYHCLPESERQPSSVQEEASKYTVGETYYTKDILRVRRDPIADDSSQIKREELTPEDYANSVDYPEENPEPASLKAGTPVTCLEIQGEFMRIGSGWIRTHDGDEVYVE